MFVERDELPFNLTQLLQDCVSDWALGRTLPEGYEDFIVAEMDRRNLRSFSPSSTEALFNAGHNIADYRLCIVEALNRWQTETSRPRTAEEVENYNRPCGE